MNYYYPQRSTHFETAALTLGILSIVCCTCIYLSIVLGALAIIFALLSKGGTTSMSTKALISLILGVSGIVLTVAFFGISLYTMLVQYGSFENILRTYCTMAGLDFDQIYGPLFSAPQVNLFH